MIDNLDDKEDIYTDKCIKEYRAYAQKQNEIISNIETIPSDNRTMQEIKEYYLAVANIRELMAKIPRHFRADVFLS